MATHLKHAALIGDRIFEGREVRYIGVSNRLYEQMREERDEAREWARKYKRLYEDTRGELYSWMNAYGEQAEDIEDLEHMYNQATCRHLFAHSYDTYPPMLMCANCGKDLS